MQTISEAMSHPPGVTGWTSFGSAYEEHMQDVKSHADTLAENIQAAASEGARTDDAAAGDYRGISSAPILSRAVNDNF
ncbi:hypothetical protein [Nocardiopsis sp. NRRL B-16309]|uniref:hypothetical protein n=1 Tax=Nocardiopsis sp. NRRL B-16309 TaxID=1519494 RepID=UPI001E3BD6BC|nr:hypothetical protein [Nocardiopsis sp. NRRL B-16309]